MKNNIRRDVKLLLLSFLFVFGGAAVTGCEEGPVEETGEEIDDAFDTR